MWCVRRLVARKVSDALVRYQYHSGFRHQVEKWPMNPLDLLIAQCKCVSWQPGLRVVSLLRAVFHGHAGPCPRRPS